MRAVRFWVKPHEKKLFAGDIVPVEKICRYDLNPQELLLLADPPLSAQGQEKADKACLQFLDRYGVPPIIFTSDRLRAIQTARVLEEAMMEVHGFGAPIFRLRQLGQGDSGDVVEGFPKDHPMYDAEYDMALFAPQGGQSFAPDWAQWIGSAHQAIRHLCGLLRGGDPEEVPVIPIIGHRPTGAAYRRFALVGHLMDVTREEGHKDGPMDPLHPDLMSGILYQDDGVTFQVAP